MRINDFVDKIYCINLKHRVDRKLNIEKQAKKYNLDIEFYNAIKHQIGWKGCFQSQLNIIKDARKNNYSKILILEDDIQFLEKPDIDETTLPEDWEILYLGGNVQVLLEEDRATLRHKKWIKMCCHCCQSYIINSSVYDEIISGLENFDKEVDVYFNDIFNRKGTSYISNPKMTSQIPSYSDIEKSMKCYDLQGWEDIVEKECIQDAPNNYNKETKDFILKLKEVDDKDLPYVSILTPTKNRRKFFQMAVHSFLNFDYPKEKLEWIIVDDSDDGTTLRGVLPRDKRIKYIRKKTKRKIPVGEKRNMCMKYASHNILVNMDDDDYYVPYSIKSRVKVLLSYPDINIVGCGFVCCYDLEHKAFYHVGSNHGLAEASMCFRRKFWEERPFDKIVMGEGNRFLKHRKDQAMAIPYNFIMFVMNHMRNVTSSERKCNDPRKFIHHFKLPTPVMKILNSIE
jgi:hypothetical protein